MKPATDLSSTRTQLLQVELAFHESGRLSTLRVTLGLPLAIAIALFEIVRTYLR
jgi:hypothetical protein